MIDFRYHVVSLVSVFLALAVGIVLGAGPLKDRVTDSLVTALQQQTKSLRDETKALRDDKDAATAAVQRRDEVLTTVSPALTADQLGGRTVVLVLLPGADSGGLDPLIAALKSAGATVTGRITVRPDWTDPARRTFRDELANQLQSALPTAVPGSGGTDRVLAALLARATVTAELVSAGAPDSQGQTILEGLRSGKLIDVDGSLQGRATLGLLVAAPVQTSDPAAPSPAAGATLNAEVALAEALDAGSSGAVAEGPASAAGPGGLLAAIRGDDAVAGKVSTVDTGGTPMGDIAAVLALSQQLTGAAGSYGFGAGADQPLPKLPQA